MISKILDLLAGGQTQRLHTMPHILHYDVAQHSWGMATLLFCLHPNPSKDLIWAIMFHDVAEVLTGDVPAPVKLAEPRLKEILEELEIKVFKDLGVNFKLTREEYTWLKALDVLECLLHCSLEYNVGNTLIAKVYHNCKKYLEEEPGTPDEVIGFLESLEEPATLLEGLN